MADAKLTALSSGSAIADADLFYSSQGGGSVKQAASTFQTYIAAAAHTFTAVQTFTPAARTSGSAAYFTITAPADTTLAASTESIGISHLGATRQFATGALTTQRETVFAAPTYGFVGASTITNAATVAIAAAPIAGTNATLTNTFSFWVQAGASWFPGLGYNVTGIRLGDGTKDTGFGAHATGASICIRADATQSASITSTRFILNNALSLEWSSTPSGVAAVTGIKRLADGVLRVDRGETAATGGWIQDAGIARVTADVTNATAVMSNISDLTITNLIAGRKYVGELVIKCNNSTAAEGISIDFDGSAATMTSFAAAATVLTGGTSVAVTTTSTALATDLNWTTITNETWIVVKLSMVVNAAGTFIPRFCEGTAHSAGTATVSLGSYLLLNDSSN